jgi:hypothetical protein
MPAASTVLQDLQDDRGSSERFWTCLTCGTLVGPLKRHQELHDAWHARHGE